MPAALGVFAALAFVLGLVVILAQVARRVAPRSGGSNQHTRIEVLSRVGLAPRQGLATVRVGGRTALVSYGDGGVRYLLDVDLDEAGKAAEDDASAAPEATSVDGRSFPLLLERAGRKVAGLRSLMLLVPALVALPFGAAPLGAQQQGARQPDQPTVAEPRQPTVPRVLDELPGMNLTLGDEDQNPLEISGPVGTVIFIGFLTLLPTLLLLMTSFTRILIVLHLLKQALGTQTAPPAHLLAAMALLLTGFVMAPTMQEVNETALAPWVAGEMNEGDMLRAAAVPFRNFMLEATREQDLVAFVQMQQGPAPETVEDIPMVTVASAFVTSELTSAFQMGFAVFLPFVVIDLVVASVLMSMGMFMLPPVMVSLPFKLLLFVLVDGWSLVMGSLVQSF
ncbi:MAG: flagellar type III secretion system pore protein FliP [Gemmatimonadota bacterium]|nr:flagellar type III secretion system pore protein FliP [Gemmatimonadota bacterium]MDH5758228.1 flagellar type III secretion system pore protein FliP [Gemmatimonadota bacterium]